MIRYVIREYFYQAPLLTWLFIIIVISVIIIFSPVDFEDSGSVVLYFLSIPIYFDNNYLVSNDSEIFIRSLFGLIALQCLIVFPKPFLDMLNKKQISMILSKDISRNEFILYNILGIFFCLLIYSAISIIILNGSIYLRTHSFSFNLLTSFIVLPFYLISVYILSILIALITDSYSSSIFGLIVYMSLSAILFSRQSFGGALHLNHPQIMELINVIYYLSPRLQDFLEFSILLFNKQQIAIDNLIGTFTSFCIPLILLFRIMNKKEF